MKVTKIELKDSVRIAPLTNGGSFLNVGMACSQAFGGGVIASMEFPRADGPLVIRKDCQFALKNNAGDVVERFDAIAIPQENLKYSFVLDEQLAEQRVQQKGGK